MECVAAQECCGAGAGADGLLVAVRWSSEALRCVLTGELHTKFAGFLMRPIM